MPLPDATSENQLDALAFSALPVDPVDRKLMSGLRIQVAFVVFTGLVVMVHPSSIRFFHSAGLDYVSCSPYRVPIARLAAAQAQLEKPVGD